MAATGRGAKGDLFSPVSMSRVSQVIVDQIKVLIRDGSLTPGDRLPSERDLCQRFGVSRVTVREALRVLEATGLVEIKVGAHGGAFLTAPTTDRVGEGLADLLSMSALTAGEVTEARKIVEIGALPLIVERATEEDIDALFKLVAEGQAAVEEGKYSMDISARFHIRLAECAHNSALAMLIQSFHGPLLMSLREAQEHAPAMGARGTDEHRQLAEAIRDGDLAAAQRVMSEHIARTAQRVSHGGDKD
jgi:DNA-binding FadR family transcriptional regulator